MGALCQELVEDDRIKKKVNNRSTVHYCQHDDSAESRGFVFGNYKRGLTPTEFFAHTQSGREGLIDTAVV